MLYWGRGYAFVYTGNEKLWNPSKLMKIICDWEKPLESLSYRHEGRYQEKLQDKCDASVKSSTWEHL